MGIHRTGRFRADRTAAALFLGAVGLVVWMAPRFDGSAGRVAEPGAVVSSRGHADRPLEERIVGLWRLEPPGPTGTPVHFYYFHPGGRGLYRYGVVGYTQTRSFDYAPGDADDRLVLRYRKSGDRYVTSIRIEGEGPGARLYLEPDPAGEAGRVYVRAPDPPVGGGNAAKEVGAEEPGPAGGIAGRMWIDLRRHATGGQSFGLYQFGRASIDGRGVGWYHAGDFDDWTTEAFSYRVLGGRLELAFQVRGERSVTEFAVETAFRGRKLDLRRDPRDFWARHTYRDAGPSFGTDAELLPWHP